MKKIWHIFLRNLRDFPGSGFWYFTSFRGTGLQVLDEVDRWQQRWPHMDVVASLEDDPAKLNVDYDKKQYRAAHLERSASENEKV